MRYHERTKHHFARFAPGPGRLDWANQPDPFRRFEGAPLTRLPLLAPDEEPGPPAYDSLYAPGAVASAPVDLRALSRLLEYSLALSAWKQAGGTRWALRVESVERQPASDRGLRARRRHRGARRSRRALFHYAPREHAPRAPRRLPAGAFRAIDEGVSAAGILSWACPPSIGARRGSTASAPSATASTTPATPSARCASRRRRSAGRRGCSTTWRTRPSTRCSASTAARDFEGAERESAELLMAVWPGDAAATTGFESADRGAVQRACKGSAGTERRTGSASDDPVRWEVIDTVAAASRKP